MRHFKTLVHAVFVSVLCLLLLQPALSQAEPSMLLGAGGTWMMCVAEDGSIWGWGENINGQLGNGHRKNVMQPIRTCENLDGTHIVSLRGGKTHMLFLMDDGTVYGCGHNADGQLGTGERTKDITTPQQVPGLENIVSLAVGFQHNLALDSSGHVWAWGHNGSGQIGNGNKKVQFSPVRLDLENITQIYAGHKYSMAMDDQGQIWGWGDNSYGQLGDVSNYKNVLSPTLLSFSGQFISLTCSNATTIGMDADGRLWAWGRNDYWQTGSKGKKKTMQPALVTGLPDEFHVVKMDSYNIHSAVLTDEGAVWQWGACGHGQYGLGIRPWHALPSEACPTEGVIDVAVNTYTSYVLMENGDVLASGGNWYGQAGTHPKISHYVMTWTSTGLNLHSGTWEDPQNK